MSKLACLFINRLDERETRVSWRLSSGVAEMDPAHAGAGALEDFLAAYTGTCPGRRILIVLDGELLSFLFLQLPTGNRKQLLQAIPFMAEEEIIGNVEEMHLSHGAPDEDGLVKVAVISRDVMGQLDVFIRNNKLPVAAVVGLPDAANPQPFGLHVILSGDTALIKHEGSCIQCDLANAADVLEGVDFISLQKVVVLLDDSMQSHRELFKVIGKLADVNDALEIITENHEESLQDLIAANIDGYFQDAVNLLQGDYSIAANDSSFLRRWAPLYGVALACVVLQVGFNYLSGYYFHHRATVIQATAKQHYLAAFPGDAPVTDLSRQIDRQLRAAHLIATTSEFSRCLGSTVDSILETGNGKDMSVLQFRYDEGTNELRVDLQMTSIALADSLKQRISSRGYHAEVLSANQDQGNVKATIVVKTG